MLPFALQEQIDKLYECAEAIDQLATNSSNFNQQLRQLARRIRSSARFAQSVAYLASMKENGEPTAA